MTNQPNLERGKGSFQKVGSFLPKTSPMPSAKDSPSSRLKPLENISQTTTGKRKQPVSTGTEVSLRGASKTLNLMAPQELADLSTGELMKALEASLPPQLALQPVWRDAETEWETPLRYTVEGTMAEKGMARRAINRTIMPLGAKALAKELTTLNALTKRRKDDQGDLQLMVAAYVEKLAPYPGEAIIHVLRKWPETTDGTWWPGWKELYEMLEYRVGERRLMLEALR